MRGRGLRNRNPNCRNSRWHWRIPTETLYRRWIKADKVLPSHKFAANPTALGGWRSTESTASSCRSLKRLGRPARSPSTNPVSPCSSKRRTQYCTVRGASPKSRPTSGQLIPWATSNTPCRRWSYRDSSDRRISSCNPRMIVGASAIVKRYMQTAYYTSHLCAITYDAMYSFPALGCGACRYKAMGSETAIIGSSAV